MRRVLEWEVMREGPSLMSEQEFIEVARDNSDVRTSITYYSIAGGRFFRIDEDGRWEQSRQWLVLSITLCAPRVSM